MPSLLELRRFVLRRGPMQQRFERYFETAALPALSRAGVEPVGAFHVLVGPGNPTAWILLQHSDADAMLRVSDMLRCDPEYAGAGADFLDALPSDPPFVRIETSLLKAFHFMPSIEVPHQAPSNPKRIFELRCYESHSEKACRAKVRMFEEREIALFRRVGLTPVFFGETLCGFNQPSLVYMLVFDSLADREQSWGRFLADPEWKELSATPGWTDAEIVTSVSSLLLRPMSCSQL